MDVWKSNFHQELKIIRPLVKAYPFIAMVRSQHNLRIINYIYKIIIILLLVFANNL